MSFSPRWIVGKTIAKVEMRPFPDGRGGTSHNPLIYFTDGSFIGFTVQETESLDYGVGVNYRKGSGPVPIQVKRDS